MKCLTCHHCLFTGDFLGHACLDGGLLHVHQQEGLWVLQSLKEQVSCSQSQNQGKGVCCCGGLFRLLRAFPLCPCSVHPHPNRQHGQSLPCAKRSVRGEGNDPVALCHQRVPGPAYLRVSLQGVQEKTDGGNLPQSLPQRGRGVSHGNIHSAGDVTDSPKSQAVRSRVIAAVMIAENAFDRLMCCPNELHSWFVK